MRLFGKTLFAATLLSTSALVMPTAARAQAVPAPKFISPDANNVEWGAATRAWIQRADRQDKQITELARTVAEPPFPGFSAFIADLSQIAALPVAWREALGAARGIYLLACPRTGELYVGSASGGDGFIGRWDQYAADGHGGNLGLKGREPSNFQVSILEVAGSLASVEEIIALEERWKVKLRSRQAGLNRN